MLMGKINYSPDATMDCLYHHGILGQKWGDRNGPPYPLRNSAHSVVEKALNSANLRNLFDREYINSDGTLTEQSKEFLNHKIDHPQKAYNINFAKRSAKKFYDKIIKETQNTVADDNFKERYEKDISKLKEIQSKEDRLYNDMMYNKNVFNYAVKVFKKEYGIDLTSENDMEYNETLPNLMHEYYHNTNNTKDKAMLSNLTKLNNEKYSLVKDLGIKAVHDTCGFSPDKSTIGEAVGYYAITNDKYYFD